MSEIRIYTSRRCGWAIRNYAALIEKGLEFRTVPANTPAGDKCSEFLELTPVGKTPVLVDGDTTVFESTLINEYIDDEHPHPPLMPDSAGARSDIRKWVHFCERHLFPLLTEAALAGGTASTNAALQRYSDAATWFGRSVLGDDWQGPYFLGARFSLLDLAFSTLFQTVETQFAGQLPAPHPAMRRWAGNVLARPSVVRAMEIQGELKF